MEEELANLRDNYIDWFYIHSNSVGTAFGELKSNIGEEDVNKSLLKTNKYL